ncbi:MAG: metallopeptidase family protein [Chloroflexi bacterium]|nr:metallopeptidase family protein [Chloroflexota bacterium]
MSRRPISPRRFTRIARQALESVPAPLRGRVSNVEIVLEDWASREALAQQGLSSPYDLLGLYQGIPLTERDSRYNLVAPDQITLYRGALEAMCESAEELEREIRATVLHELAHHFGLSDDELAALSGGTEGEGGDSPRAQGP